MTSYEMPALTSEGFVTHQIFPTFGLSYKTAALYTQISISQRFSDTPVLCHKGSVHPALIHFMWPRTNWQTPKALIHWTLYGELN